MQRSRCILRTIRNNSRLSQTCRHSSTSDIPIPTPIFGRYGQRPRRTEDFQDNAENRELSAQRDHASPKRQSTVGQNSGYSHIVFCDIHGTTVAMTDILRLLNNARQPYDPPIDHVLHRSRFTQSTHLTIEAANDGEGTRLRRLLALKYINGKRVQALPNSHATLPPKYDPLYISPQSGPGRVVSLEGLPYIYDRHLRRALHGYALVDNPDFQFQETQRLASHTVWLVRLKTEEEAHRVVKNFNNTYFEPNAYGRRHPIKAEIFY